MPHDAEPEVGKEAKNIITTAGLSNIGYALMVFGFSMDLPEIVKIPSDNAIAAWIIAHSNYSAGFYGGLAFLSAGVLFVVGGEAIRWMRADAKIRQRVQSEILPEMKAGIGQLRELREAIQNLKE